MNNRNISVLTGGALFGFGLSLSTMIKPEVVLSFLQFKDLGLLLVLGGAVIVTLLAYSIAPKLMKKPVCGKAFGRHHDTFNKKVVSGAALFGIGWGLAGVCPGPAIAGVGAGNFMLLFSVLGLLLGAYAQGRFFSN
jgi:uncharacterized membrane protein YedE/YeeE